MQFDYDETTYGDAWVDFYDDPLLGWPDPGPAVAFLHRRAGDGRALDLGAGTGRVAIPLARTGVRVTAVDASKAMLDRLASKAADAVVDLIHANLVQRCIDEQFDLIYCIGQSFLQLQTAQEQRTALATMGEMLTPNGVVVIEALTPDIKRFRVGQDFLANKILPDQAVMTASTHHPLEQRIHSLTIRWTPNGAQFLPNFIRYCWPSELVLMAELAGLELVGRYTTWTGAPYQGRPGAYIVEFRKAPPA